MADMTAPSGQAPVVAPPENVANHRRFLAGETGSAQDSPAPKPAKPTRKPKPTAQKARINILQSSTASGARKLKLSKQPVSLKTPTTQTYKKRNPGLIDTCMFPSNPSKNQNVNWSECGSSIQRVSQRVHRLFFMLHWVHISRLVPFVPSSPLLLLCARLMVVSPLSTSFEGSLICVELEPSSGFGTGSPFVSVNTKPLKAKEELVIQHAEVTAESKKSLKPELFVVHSGSVAAWIKDRKCKTKERSFRPPVNLPDVLELKDATVCHLKISAITLPAWKNHLDNHMDVELLDCHTLKQGLDRNKCPGA
nr:hypothetical protein [Tanacetum cinerariifolium]